MLIDLARHDPRPADAVARAERTVAVLTDGRSRAILYRRLLAAAPQELHGELITAAVEAARTVEGIHIRAYLLIQLGSLRFGTARQELLAEALVGARTVTRPEQRGVCCTNR